MERWAPAGPARVARVIERVVLRPGVARPRVDRSPSDPVWEVPPDLDLSSDDEADGADRAGGGKAVLRPGVVKS